VNQATIKALGAFFAFGFLLLGCSASSSKKIAGRYRFLEFSEGPTDYYVIEKGDDSPGGIFDGVVHRVARQEDLLFGKVTRLASIDPSGWYSLNLKTGLVLGPLPDTEIPSGSIPSEQYFERL